MRSSLFLVLLFYLITPPSKYLSAQEASVAGPTGGPVFRLGFWEMLHQTYWTDEDNTFYQMTGTNRFRGGKGYQGIPSFNVTDIYIPDGLSSNVNTKRTNDGNEHSKVDSAIGRITDWLPSFSLEYILPTNYWVGAGMGFHYTNTWLDDTSVRAATTGSDPSYATPLLRMFTRFYMFSGSLYFPGTPKPGGIDFFFGFGLSYVEATYAWGIRPNPDIYNNYGEAFYLQKTYMRSSGILPIQRFGLASSSDTFGFMLEFIRLPQRDLLDNPFKNQSFISSEAYNAAYNERGEDLPAKVGMGGMITRASWTYSFW